MSLSNVNLARQACCPQIFKPRHGCLHGRRIPADPWRARLLSKILFEKKEVTTVADF
jgi:hypothetical protein